MGRLGCRYDIARTESIVLDLGSRSRPRREWNLSTDDDRSGTKRDAACSLASKVIMIGSESTRLSEIDARAGRPGSAPTPCPSNTGEDHRGKERRGCRSTRKTVARSTRSGAPVPSIARDVRR